MKHRAFTLTELLIGMLILTVTAGVFYLDSDALGRQTAKREAERAAMYIQSHMRRTDVTQDVLWIRITSDDIELKNGMFAAKNDYDNAKVVEGQKFEAMPGCRFQSDWCLVYPKNTEQNLGTMIFKPIPSGASINTGTGTAGKYCITVNGADGQEYNILIGDQP